jgi:uncharacterized membrane protein
LEEDHCPFGDARTLSEARIIEADTKRLTAAQKAAKELAQKKDKESAAYHQIAGTKPKLNPAKENPPEKISKPAVKASPPTEVTGPKVHIIDSTVRKI